MKIWHRKLHVRKNPEEIFFTGSLTAKAFHHFVFRQNVEQ